VIDAVFRQGVVSLPLNPKPLCVEHMPTRQERESVTGLPQIVHRRYHLGCP
jgi:hypothetical protein